MPKQKRGRTDSGIGKDEYNAVSEMPSRSPPQGGRSNFGGVMVNGGGNSNNNSKNSSGRRTVSAKHPLSLKGEYLKNLAGLNNTFVQYCSSNSNSSDFVEAAKDYLSYARDLRATYRDSGLTSILTFGSGDCGQLAHGIDEDDEMIVSKPRKVMTLAHSSVRTVSAGGLHNVACTNSGDVYTWGCNDDGSVGRGGEEFMPQIVPDIKGICGAAGDCQTIVVDGKGTVYMWGTYKDKEGKTFRDATNPGGLRGKNVKPEITSVPTSEGKLVELKCGASFNVGRTENGGVWTWGLGECGELGRKANDMKVGGEYDLEGILRTQITPKAPLFASVSSKRFVRKIGAGAYHLLVITVEGSSGGGVLWTCGLNNYGQLGLGDINPRHELTCVEVLTGERVEDADGGMHHSVCLTSDGKVFSFGRGDSGQLGVKEECEVGYCEESPVKV
ncbi:hypothetical protein TL16_g04773 [Triparma laevis f. inornata]|nr:hypothetical protein TL16_g04773 [Triparma laevis f. inornata]